MHFGDFGDFRHSTGTLRNAATAFLAAWTPALPQTATNGASTYGTLSHSPLGPWVNGPMPHGFPWGLANAWNTNPYNKTTLPNTGMTRYYNWEITNTTMAPDGVSIAMLVVNGQFPGPLIEANWGDWIEVTVTNCLEVEGTALHWHGFLQTGTPFYDGVPGVSQCPIAPGKTFTYRFRAELYGSSWWHGHYSSQYINGMSGPIVIHGPCSDQYDIDIGPVMLSDWFHDYYKNLVEQVFRASPFGPILPPMANNMLINGKANYNCSNTNLPCVENAGLARFSFTSGKRHLLRLINHGAEATVFFSIDGYNMTVIANDFVPVQPYQTDLATLAVGQRMDVVVYGHGSPTDAVWMRLTEGGSGTLPPGQAGCSLNDGLAYNVSAAIYYEDADTSIPPETVSTINPDRFLTPDACSNGPLSQTIPMYPLAVKEPSYTQIVNVIGTYNASGDFVWLMNGVSYFADYNYPSLLQAKLGVGFAPERTVYNFGHNDTIRIIFYTSGIPASHPMHIHGHNFQVLAWGTGDWDGTITNPDNPQRRDTQLIPPYGYVVVQLDLDNPGVWPFHCHIAWHISEGMNINIYEHPYHVMHDLEIPDVMAQTCRDWAEWSGVNVVPQIDSGL